VTPVFDLFRSRRREKEEEEKEEVVVSAPNYQAPSIQKLRKLVEKHLLTRTTLEEIEKLDKERVDLNQVAKMADFRGALESIFPAKELPNIGLKLQSLDKNIFLNEFLYNILADIPGFQHQVIMREHFVLNAEAEM